MLFPIIITEAIPLMKINERGICLLAVYLTVACPLACPAVAACRDISSAFLYVSMAAASGTETFVNMTFRDEDKYKKSKYVRIFII